MLVSVVSQPDVEYRNRRFTITGKKRLGAFLRACRIAHGWTLEQVVERTRLYEAQMHERRGKTTTKPLGVALSNISRYENGNYEKPPSLDHMWILLDVLKPINPETRNLMQLEELLLIGTEELNLNIDIEYEAESN
jgi:transcriptional regulator with XRE-family HTH domain